MTDKYGLHCMFLTLSFLSLSSLLRPDCIELDCKEMSYLVKILILPQLGGDPLEMERMSSLRVKYPF